MRRLIFVGMALIVPLLAAGRIAAQNTSPPPATASIAGAWTLNADLSDKPADGGDRGERGGRDARGRGNGGFGRGGGRGGFGGGFGRGGGRERGGGRGNPEDVARMRDAMRDLMNPSDHLTITQTDSMIVITAGDGRTTRLSPDGKKIKDDNTGIERKTKWEGGHLVSEISGLGPGKMTQTFTVDPDKHQLRVTVLMEGRGSQSNQPRTVTHVYDRDSGFGIRDWGLGNRDWGIGIGD